MAKEIFVSSGVDIDAVAGWLGSYGGEDSPDDISRGLFAGEVGVPRIPELFRREGLTQTFLWPGHSIETFPEQFAACVAAGLSALPQYDAAPPCPTALMTRPSTVGITVLTS